MDSCNKKLKEQKRKMIKAIIFDYGQVISFPPDPAVLDELAAQIGVARKTLEPVFWQLRDEYDRGTFSTKEYYRAMLSRLNVSKTDAEIDRLIALDWASWQNINPETVQLMHDIKSAGLILGILSNMAGEFLAWARANVPAFSLADVAVFSCDYNLIKPERAIYETLLSALNSKYGAIAGGDLVFFDDKIENIKGAQALGIAGVLWESPEHARRELRAMGVKL
jgi:putative hydrolase of the HAD superfamily